MAIGVRTKELNDLFMSNYWSTNFVSSQGGDFTFRYSLFSSANFQPEQLTRSGWEQMTQLEADAISAGPPSAPLPSESANFLSIDNPNIALTTWKLAEDGHGSILRLVETAGTEAHLQLSTPHLHIKRAWHCSILEDCGQELPITNGALSLEIKPFEILTLRLETETENRP